MKTRLMVWAATFFVFAVFGLINSRAMATEFEVASIKPTKSPTGVSGGCHGSDAHFGLNDPRATIGLGRCVITAGRLSHIMAIAYEIDVNNIGGRPDWDGPSRFDVEAKAESLSATQQQLLQMLQAMLADRFKLKVLRETTQLPGFALVVAKNGPKLKEARESEESRLTVSGAKINKFDAANGKNPDLNTITGRKISMAQLAEALSRGPAEGPVVDRTGLTRFYDFTLTWEPSELLTSALQSQLGLRLDAQKVPVDVMTIISAERPTEN